MSGIVFNVGVEDLSKFIIASRKCHRDLALTKHCIGGGEVGNLTSMEEMLLVFEGVSDKELCVTETLDVGMFDGAWVKFGKLLFRSDIRHRVVMTRCHNWRGIMENDVGVGHDSKNR